VRKGDAAIRPLGIAKARAVSFPVTRMTLAVCLAAAGGIIFATQAAGESYNPAAATAAIYRGYAAAQRALPYDIRVSCPDPERSTAVISNLRVWPPQGPAFAIGAASPYLATQPGADRRENGARGDAEPEPVFR
jgi:hypothetical protein